MASPALSGQITREYERLVEAYIPKHQLPVVLFQKGDRKDKIARKMRRKFTVPNGVVFVGVAQEKAQTFKGTQGVPSVAGHGRDEGRCAYCDR